MSTKSYYHAKTKTKWVLESIDPLIISGEDRDKNIYTFEAGSLIDLRSDLIRVLDVTSAEEVLLALGLMYYA